MKLVVATLLLAAAALVAKVAVEHLAPERVASASTQVTDGRAEVAGQIRSIRFDAPGLRAAALLPVIDSREGDTLDPALLGADRARLEQWLVARGHLDAQVGEPRVRLAATGAHIDIQVTAGPVFVIREVRIEGKRAGLAGLRSVPTITAGHEVVADRVDGNVTLLRDWLAHRKVKANVRARLEVDRFTKQVDVVFTVD